MGRGAPAAIAAGVAAALALGAGPVQAASVFDVFTALCLDTNADPSAVLQKAKAMGWPKASKRLVRLFTKPSEKGEVTTGAAGRGLRTLDGSLAVLVARTSWMIPRTEIPADTCSVVAGPAIDTAAVAKDAEGHAAVPGQLGLAFQKTAIGYLWHETEGRHEPLTIQQLMAAPRSDDVKMLIIMQIKDVAVLQLFVPAKEQN